MMNRRHIACAPLLLTTLRPASAWNGTGQEIIAWIAWQELTPQTRENVTRLLKAYPDYADMLTKADKLSAAIICCDASLYGAAKGQPLGVRP